MITYNGLVQYICLNIKYVTYIFEFYLPNAETFINYIYANVQENETHKLHHWSSHCEDVWITTQNFEYSSFTNGIILITGQYIIYIQSLGQIGC